MDIFCPRCGEPLDHDELHEVEGMSYQEASQAFRTKGCEGIGFRCNIFNQLKSNAMIAQAAYDILGEDMDGAASMFDDAEFLGLMD
jgi:hypothetical protein